MSASSEPEERIREGYEQNFFLSIGAAAVPENKMQYERGLYEKVRKSDGDMIQDRYVPAGEGKHSLSSIPSLLHFWHHTWVHSLALPAIDLQAAAFNG